MSRSFADRFPTVARLVGLAQAESEESADGADAPTNEDENAGGEGEDQEQVDPPAETDDEDGDEGEGTSSEGEPGATVLHGVTSASNLDTQLQAAFERDASAQVAAERQRCIDVFTSPAGRRNVDGAALLLGDDDMAAVGASKIATLLGTMGSPVRSSARDRLNGSDARPDTGASSDAAAGTSDAIKAARLRQSKKNETVKGGKKVGASAPLPAAQS